MHENYLGYVVIDLNSGKIVFQSEDYQECLDIADSLGMAGYDVVIDGITKNE